MMDYEMASDLDASMVPVTAHVTVETMVSMMGAWWPVCSVVNLVWQKVSCLASHLGVCSAGCWDDDSDESSGKDAMMDASMDALMASDSDASKEPAKVFVKVGASDPTRASCSALHLVAGSDTCWDDDSDE